MELHESNINGKANAGLATGIVGAALGAANSGILGNFGFGMGMNNGCNGYVTRYELGKEQELLEAKNENTLLKANIYNDQKSLELYKYMDEKFNKQAVENQKMSDSILMLNERLACEIKERKCADNTIVNYANATFYPKMVADVTTGTTTVAQTVYNPLPCQSCCG